MSTAKITSRGAGHLSDLHQPGRAILSAALFLGSMIIFIASVNVIGRQDAFRLQFDATKTRAYSLSPATRDTLGRLQGDWTIALISLQSMSDRAMHAQVNEVLRRFEDASDHVSVMQIDPSQPESLIDFEALLTRLRATYQREIAAYDEALDRGVQAFEQAVLFIQQQAAAFDAAAQSLPTVDPSREGAAQAFNLIVLITDQRDAIMQQLAAARDVSDEQPIPDFESARSILAQVLTQLSQHMASLGTVFDDWANRAELDPTARRFASEARGTFTAQADQLAVAADPLRRLPPLEISSLGQQLQQGELGIVIGPASAAVIPASQLFPRTRVGQASAAGVVTFDQRFRGEQIISAAINSLLEEQMPLVVFVHAEPEPMLTHRERNADLFGLASMLSLSRYQVREWQVGQAERPATAADQPIVWVVVPPIVSSGLEPTRQETMLLQATRRLLSEGESVLLNFNPSVMPKFRQSDPWADLAAPFGLSADTGRVVSSTIRVDEKRTRTQRSAAIQIFDSDHIIARAVDGLHTYFHWPVRLELSERNEPGLTRSVVAAVPADSSYWMDADWLDSANESTPSVTPTSEAIPLVVAAERAHPEGRGRQRLVAVGSGAWMLTFVADAVASLGGTRVALENPGNYELAMASIAWLAQMDHLIAPGAATRQVARLNGVTDRVKTSWRWIAMAGVPGACLLCGGIMWFVRRR